MLRFTLNGRAVELDASFAQQPLAESTFGLGAAIKDEITIGGHAVQRGFRDYPLLTIAEMPQIEVCLIASDAPPTGAGEGPVPPIAPAVANAVYAATGKRLRSLPLRL